ncbi:TonB family protein [candidate division KSB1 bacterium]|nr:TonB family protein [candidate division KSB1 bacterium]RQW11357.1 MAG: TonB family protein [candidate division KSB1 bacterium]
MKKYLEKLSEMNKSVLLSVLLHIVLLLLFTLFRSGLDFPDQEFAEIGFVAATTARASTTPSRPAASVQTPEQADEAAAAKPSLKKEEATAPPVVLPTRRMLEEEEPDLTKRQSGKLTPAQDNAEVARDVIQDSEPMQKEVAERATSGKSSSETSGAADAGEDRAVLRDSGDTANDQPYTLEGDASRRTILSQVLPEYPPGVQREAVVRIRFWVLPDGRIGAMIPVLKGDPTLEEITMKAMRQWRFNALPAGEEQKNVEGIITFVYKLE